MENEDSLVKKIHVKKGNETTKVNLPNKEMGQVIWIGGSSFEDKLTWIHFLCSCHICCGCRKCCGERFLFHEIAELGILSL